MILETGRLTHCIGLTSCRIRTRSLDFLDTHRCTRAGWSLRCFTLRWWHDFWIFGLVQCAYPRPSRWKVE